MVGNLNQLKEIEIKRREALLKIIGNLPVTMQQEVSLMQSQITQELERLSDCSHGQILESSQNIDSYYEQVGRLVKRVKDEGGLSRRGFLQMSSLVATAGLLELSLSRRSAAEGMVPFGFFRQGARIKDTNFSTVSLLLDCDGTNGAQNNTFIDSSSNAYAITRGGTPSQGSFSPYATNGWSAYFDGTGDYLTAPNNAGTNIGTADDFTIEFWVYAVTQINSNPRIVSNAVWNSSGGFDICIQAGTVILFTNGGAAKTATFGSTDYNQWLHFAFSRQSGTLRVFKSGVLANSYTSNTDNLTSANPIHIGTYQAGTTVSFTGYISNLRIIKGTAVYTAAFTPPTTLLTAISNTQLLCLQSNRFNDNSTNAFALTSNGNPITTNFSPFVAASTYSASSSGGSRSQSVKTDYLSIPVAAPTNSLTGDFTIECWIYPSDGTLTTAWGIIDTRTAGSTAANWIISLGSYSAGWLIDFYTGASHKNSIRVQPYQWSHIALVRSGSTISFFVNGILDSTTATISGTITGGSGVVTLGNTKDSNLAGYGNNGFISDLRIVNGTAIYSASFTPPISPLTAIANTSLLLKFVNAGIYDKSGKNNIETIGSAQIATAVKQYGTGSIAFNGTTDWLTVSDNPLLRFGTGNFTIELSVYRTASGTYGLISKGTGTTGWSVALNSSNQVVFFFAGSSITSTGTISANTWTAIAIVRSGTGASQTKIYIAGSNDGTGTAATDFTGTDILYIGADRVGAAPFAGNMDNLRITLGIARYSANYTPATTSFV
ncbi:MAG: LamG domain-containing protein [Bacteriovorax sp.]|nr:LamG domain-containing protein [Bacteriovorax sp.]